MLGREHLRQIVDIQLQRLHRRIAERGYQLDVQESARDYLAEVGYDPDFGARPLKRAIQRELQDPLALKLLSGEFPDGATIHVARGDDGLVFSA